MDKIEVSERARNATASYVIDAAHTDDPSGTLLLHAFARFERDILSRTPQSVEPVATDVAALVEAAYREGWRGGLASERPCSPYRTDDDDWADSDAFAALAAMKGPKP